MLRVKTLNELSHLRESRFGQPLPRHGLSLLWWFARHCVQIDNNGRMIALCNPAEGDFGFRRFSNEDGRLPDTNLFYYEVGNLNPPGLLPRYVTQNYDSDLEETNSDRIIVSVDSTGDGKVCFQKVYVAQLDGNHTFRISQGLVRVIKNSSRSQFAIKTVLILPLLLSCLCEYYRQKEKESRKASKNCVTAVMLISCVIGLTLVYYYVVKI